MADTPLTTFRYASPPDKPTWMQSPQKNLEYRYNLIRRGYKPEEVEATMQQFAGARSPEGALIEGVMPLLQQKLQQDVWASSPEGMKAQLELARADAKEKAKQTLLWSTLAKLPEQLATAVNPFGGPAGAAMAYQGMSAIPGIYNQTLATYPQIQSPGYSSQQPRYF